MTDSVTPLSGKRLALHVCCGPCFIEPYDAFVAQAADVVAVFFNPNIHPVQEYERRRDTLLAYADELGVAAVELPYDPAAWLELAGRHASDRDARCRACYRLRLERVARWAAEHGFDAMSTTLTVSPYQDAEAIAQEGDAAATRAGITFVARDFTDRYVEATRRSRERGMYRQNYCGCVMSDLEATQERAQRRAVRAAKQRGKGVP